MEEEGFIFGHEFQDPVGHLSNVWKETEIRVCNSQEKSGRKYKAEDGILEAGCFLKISPSIV